MHNMFHEQKKQKRREEITKENTYDMLCHNRLLFNTEINAIRPYMYISSADQSVMMITHYYWVK